MLYISTMPTEVAVYEYLVGYVLSVTVYKTSRLSTSGLYAAGKLVNSGSFGVWRSIVCCTSSLMCDTAAVRSMTQPQHHILHSTACFSCTSTRLPERGSLPL
jgi:hypothetical protein